ncbi:hypothetical protein [uncultured Kordia sp.]|uniref:hypothetical protein n=1 Tax=uncultured Kordia sp. TaxID=507699 RepID=UPI00263759E2|nr:hypothetical protein [uncultured Kordia sp.]
MGIEYPILYVDQDFSYEFSVFHEDEELVLQSISSHWGWDFEISKKVDTSTEIITDSNGIQYSVNHSIYSEKFKQGCSYADEIIGCIELPRLKKEIIRSLRKYIEERFPEKEESIKTLINIIRNVNTFEELIISLDVNLYKL